MKNIILSVIFLLLFIACDELNDEEIYKYSEIYYNILVIREKFPDTAVANPKVIELLAKNGYNQQSFQKASFELFEKDKTLFTKMIDSVRKKAEQEVKNLNEKNKKEN